eukprot:CCRYP_003039-RA/>CCRYP_003039-RA protein AED:0.09 eAED:-0.01 QI:0/1/0/1/1/1/2/0/310
MEFVMEKLAIMKQQETTHYRASNYLSQNAANATVNDRRALCIWGFDIMRICRIDRSIAVIGISFFDRFLSHYESRVVQCCLHRRREFQLAFISCLMISIKARDGKAVKLQFINEYLCKGMYHLHEITQMEIEILRTLSWRLNGPTAIDFIQCFMELLPSTIEPAVAMSLTEISKANAENAMLNYMSVLQAPSIIALASIASSLELLSLPLSYLVDIRSWMMQCTTSVTTEDWPNHHNDIFDWRRSGLINRHICTLTNYFRTKSVNCELICSGHEEASDFGDECGSFKWATSSLRKNLLDGESCEVFSPAA